MSRNERQKITTDKFRDSFEEIFGKSLTPEEAKELRYPSKLVDWSDLDISKKNTKMEDKDE